MSIREMSGKYYRHKERTGFKAVWHFGSKRELRRWQIEVWALDRQLIILPKWF